MLNLREKRPEEEQAMGDHAFNLRRAGAGDAPAVAALSAAAYAKWLPVLGRPPKPMTADYATAIDHHLIDLLYIDGDLAALVEMIPEPDHLLIENLAVLPARQGGGYGRRLMTHAEQQAQALGYDEVRLYTNQAFVENLAFYHRLGYRIDRTEPFRGGFIVHLSKRIS